MSRPCAAFFLFLAAVMSAFVLDAGVALAVEITSSDQLSRIEVPEGWMKQANLHEDAEIQLFNPQKDLYLIVLSESKMDFDNIGYEEHSGMTRKSLLHNLTNGKEVGDPIKLDINGMPALQYEITGSVNKLRVVYLHTTVDGKKTFHQIIAWCLPSNFQKYRAELETVIKSFKEAE